MSIDNSLSQLLDNKCGFDDTEISELILGFTDPMIFTAKDGLGLGLRNPKDMVNLNMYYSGKIIVSNFGGKPRIVKNLKISYDHGSSVWVDILFDGCYTRGHYLKKDINIILEY